MTGDERERYASPAAEDATPRVLFFFKLYASVLAVVYASATVLVPLVFLRTAGHVPPMQVVVSVLFAGVAAVHVVAARAPREPWAWSLAAVLLVMGVLSCYLPFALPLLIAWNKPLVRAAHRRL